MERSPKQEERKLRFAEKSKDIQERIKEAFWSDFIVGGLMVSGIFLIMDSLNLSRETNFIVGIAIVLVALSLTLWRNKQANRLEERFDKLRELAEKFFNKREYKKSVRYFGKIIRIDRKDAEVWLYKGIALAELERYKKAIVCYNAAFRLGKEDFYLWHNKAIALWKLEQYKESIIYFDKAIEVNDKNHYAWHNKGIVLSKLGRYEEAIMCYDKVIELNGAEFYLWYNKAIALSQLKRYEEATVCFDKAIELNKSDSTLWYNKGIELWKLGRNEEATVCYDKAIELKINNVYVSYTWYRKACFESLRNLKQESIKSLREAIKLDKRYKNDARSNPDFDNIRNSDEFRQLVR